MAWAPPRYDESLSMGGWMPTQLSPFAVDLAMGVIPSGRVPVNSIAGLNVRFNSWLLFGSLGDGVELLLCVFQRKC